LKNFDNHIQDILSSKLGNLETEVSPHIWSGIESQLAQQAAAAGTTAAAKTIAAKWLWAAAIATSVTIATVAIVQMNKPEQPAANPTVEQPAAPVAQTTTENADNNTEVSAGNPSEMASSVDQKTTSDNTTRPLSTGPEHEIEYRIDLNSIDKPLEAPFAESGAQQGISGHDKGTPLPSNPTNPDSPIANPSHQGPQETATAKFSPVTVNQKDLRYFFIPEFTKGVQYHWLMGDGSEYDSANPTHEYAEEGEYLVTLNVSDGNGKTFVEAITVKAFKPVEVKIPTIFSPNGDGKNDVFEFEVLSGQVQWSKIVILNNAGTVFESNGDEMWNGLDNHGNECAEGLYTYLVRGRDRNQAVIEKTGSVTLRRSR
jgi:gliding motility-associated-like protein